MTRPAEESPAPASPLPILDSVETLRPWLSLDHADGVQAGDLLGPGRAGRLVWQDPTGGIYAVCERQDASLTVTVPGVARFRAGPTPPILAEHFDNASDDAVQLVFHRFALPMILQARGLELLHASAIQIGSGVVALCADSGTGKSTTAGALAQRGHEPWADDVVALDLREKDARVVGLPFEFRLDPSFELGAPAGRPAERCDRGPLTAIVLLERAESGITVERLTPAQAFKSVFAQAMCFDLSDEARKSEMFDRYFELAESAPIVRIAFEPGFDRIDGLLDAIEQIGRSES